MPDANKPDRNQSVREHITRFDLPPETREEVIAELSAHLEDLDVASFTGDPLVSMPSTNAWRKLARAIQHAKSEEDSMNQRTRTLWLPAMSSILGASLSMSLLQWMGVQPHLLWTKHVALFFYWSWLAVLPVFGAVAAYLSRRSGGSIRYRLTAALAPVLWLLLPAFLIEPVEIAHRGFSHLLYFSYGVTNWIVIPGIALLLGAAPLLGEERLQKTARI